MTTRNKKRQARRRRRRRIIFGIELTVLLVLIGALLVYAKINQKMDKMNFVNDKDTTASDIEINETVINSERLKGYTNIALFGVDSRDGDMKTGNSDTAIVASINNDTKNIKLVSLYRDTYLDVGNGQYTKCNAAYSEGGPSQAINMMNTNLDLDMTNYVAVDFKALATTIDCLGGLEIPLSYAEIVHTNNYCVETSEVTGMSYDEIEKPEEKPEDENAILGTYHLNGVQATAYCRIRKTDGWDMKRTERQRDVIALIVEKAKKANLSELNKIMDEVFPLISTNFSKSELVKLGMGILSYQLGETSGFPTDNYMGEEVVSAINLDCVIPTTLETNVKYLHQFLFEDTAYQPSETVLNRSDYIAGVSGFGNSYVPAERKSLISERESTYTGDSYQDETDSYSNDDTNYDSEEDYSQDYNSEEDYNSDDEEY